MVPLLGAPIRLFAHSEWAIHPFGYFEDTPTLSGYSQPSLLPQAQYSYDSTRLAGCASSHAKILPAVGFECIWLNGT
jgi:hypothetical protein